VSVQVEEELAVRVLRGEFVAGADRERGLADAQLQPADADRRRPE
jgi:hypothetical protein